MRRFANLKEIRDEGIRSYAEAVKNGTFPDPETESYTMDKLEWARFMEKEIEEDDGDSR